MGMRPSQTSIGSFFVGVRCCKSQSLSRCKSRCCMAFHPPTRPFLYCNVSVYSTWKHFLEFLGIINFGAFCWLRHCVVASHSPCSLPSCSLRKCHTCRLGTSLCGSFICASSHSAHSRSISYSLEFKFQSCLLALLSCDDLLVMFLAINPVVFCYLLVLCLGLVRMYGLRVAMYLYARALL